MDRYFGSFCPIHQTTTAICMDCIPPVSTGIMDSMERRAQQEAQQPQVVYVQQPTPAYQPPAPYWQAMPQPEQPLQRYAPQHDGSMARAAAVGIAAGAAIYAAQKYARRQKALQLQAERSYHYQDTLPNGEVIVRQYVPDLAELEREVHQAEKAEARQYRRDNRGQIIGAWIALALLVVLVVGGVYWFISWGDRQAELTDERGMCRSNSTAYNPSAELVARCAAVGVYLD